MKRKYILLSALLSVHTLFGQSLEQRFREPADEAAPWTFWYWMYGAVSKAGITADLESMKEVGLEGAYLMPIRSHKEKELLSPSVEQLSPEWWEMVRFAMSESERLGLKLGMHICDGFALAGGPWITPEKSMQQVVSADTVVSVKKNSRFRLPQPKMKCDYYEDIAVFAVPVKGERLSSMQSPSVTSSVDSDPAPAYLTGLEDGTFRSSSDCWIQYAFEEPFTCRSISLEPGGNNYQAHRLHVYCSEDGVNFRSVKQLTPARSGWQNTDAGFTYSIPATTSCYFRFTWSPEGSEPGAEDMDAAKWKPNLKLKGVSLQEIAKLDNFEGKSAQVWRLAARNGSQEIAPEDCIQLSEIREVTAWFKDGELALPAEFAKNRWRIVRLGHTTTGHTNATGGEGKGLECDKFSPEAVALQFDRWFAEALRQGGETARKVLTRMHVDSWECGSQNWSSNFADQFKKRRGYDLHPYLLLYAGIPVESAEISESVLADIRQTIAELVVDVFYETLAQKAKSVGCEFSAECVAPTMMSDGLAHYAKVDRPMGEFWLESPTHDKPNDMADAISGAHIYGKNIIQAEGFTQLRTMWDEHPGNLKTLLDANYALGINKLFFHVFTHNPFTEKAPGMTLEGIGLYMQRDQTWWSQSVAWIDYIKRCQSLLQYGSPVNDIAVFIGEDTPRRAILPDRLTSSLPGLVGKKQFKANRDRMRNVGQPLRTMPVGVTHSANMADPQDWIDPLRGYGYDCINPDALLRLAKVENGRMVLPGGASYKVLVLPLPHQMNQNHAYMSVEIARKIKELQAGGVVVLLGEKPVEVPGNYRKEEQNAELANLTRDIWNVDPKYKLPYTDANFAGFGLIKDAMFIDELDITAEGIAWTHRTGDLGDLYFVSNQLPKKRVLKAYLRAEGTPELWDPATGQMYKVESRQGEPGQRIVSLELEPNQSLFVVFPNRQIATEAKAAGVRSQLLPVVTPWTISYGDTGLTETVSELTDWASHPNDSIRYFSGTAQYSTVFKCNPKKGERVLLNLGAVGVIAGVRVNDIDCGIVWTNPFRVDITEALKKGRNTLQIAVTNCWANRIKGVTENKVSGTGIWTNAPYRLADEPLQQSGLWTPLKLDFEK
ncbi:MAG: glycosyl hydrolase [Bacteroidales bacterium]